MEHERRMMDISTKDIVINPLAQRDADRRVAQFKRIMKEFNPDLVQPISVAFIDGKYYCYDGQLTMKVLKERNKGRDCVVSCIVMFGLTMPEMADLFIQQRGITAPPKLSDKIRVQANFGDPDALNFVRLTEKNGFRLDRGDDDSSNLILIQATTRLWNEFKTFNDNDKFEQLLRILYNGFKGDPMQTNNKILGGLALFIRTYDGKFDENALISALSRTRAGDIIRDADVDRSNGYRKYALKILDTYNLKKHKANRLPNIL